MSRNRRRVLSFALAVSLSASLTLVAVPAAAQQDECPEIMPLSEVEAGMTGTGRTVARGTTPTTFTVEVLGLLEDGIAPGRDMIVVEASGAAIDDAGGIWFGMSGSPVYIGDRLVGALAFGFSATSRVAGLTPAADLVQVLDGGGPASAASWSAWERAEDARSYRVDGREGTFSRLTVPLTVSGLAPERLDAVAERLADQGLDVLPVAAGGTASTSAVGAMEPGGNFAGALSTGDLTAAGIGTTSYVCDDEVVAFGHPFFFGGETSIAAAGADALAIIEDGVFGPYKLASLGALVGTVEQDRLAGIGGSLGPVPAGTEVSSTVDSVGNGVTRSGTTEIYDDVFVPGLTFGHMLSNVDSVFDQIGAGSATIGFTIDGRRADGTAFRVTRDNVFASTFDIAFETILELDLYLFLLAASGIEDVTIGSVAAGVEVDPAVRRLTLGSATVTVDGGEPIEVAPLTGEEGFVPELPIGPGSEVLIEAVLAPFGSSGTVVETLELRVPEDAPAGFGSLVIRGGPGFELFGFGFECQFDPSQCPGSFDQLLEELAERPRNDDLVAEVLIFPEGGPGPEGDPVQEEAPAGPGPEGEPVQEEPGSPPVVEPGLPGGEQVVARAVTRLDRPVSGELFAPVFPLFGPEPQPGGVSVERAAGPDRIRTAVALSELTYPERGTADTVVVAGADASADALAAAPLAAVRGGPVLLTPRDGLDGTVAAEIGRLGATRAVIVGGTAAVSGAVEDALAAAGLAVQRIGGADRTATAAAVAAGIPGAHAYVVGTGASVDAAAVAGLAALERAPILFAGDGLSAATADALAARRAVTVVGGTRAVPEPVAQELRVRGLSVDRLAGRDRYGTSAAIVQRSLEVGASPFVLFVATGRAVADALVAGAAAAAVGAPLLLVDGQDPGGAAPARQLLGQLAGGVGSVVVAGGEAAVTPAVVDRIVELLGPSGGGGSPQPPPPPPPPVG